MIDFIVAIALVFAVYKGYSKGLVVAIFSFLGFVIGLAAALKCSAAVASYLQSSTGADGKWVPFLSFLLVFVAVVFLVRLGANLIQKSLSLLMLGWVNKIGGILFFVLLYCIIISIFLFYAVQLHLVSAETTSASMTYPYLQPLAPKVINAMGDIIPWFKNMFGQLQDFFGKVVA